MNEESKNELQEILINILEGESQVVAGVKYRLKLEFGDSNCTKEVFLHKFINRLIYNKFLFVKILQLCFIIF